jgi:excisionase family DNA binding protein
MSVLPLSAPSEPFLDKQEVAARLGVTRRTVDLWAKERGLPYHQVVGRRRYRWSEILDWIHERRDGGGSE